MAIGSVTIARVNNNQGETKEPERIFLYLGTIADPELAGEVIPIGYESDLDVALGTGDSELKTQIEAARSNSRSENFRCYAIGIAADKDWKEAAYAVLDKPHDLNIEAVVLCTALTSKVEVEACQAAAAQVLIRCAKYVAIIAAVPGINSATETWSEYLARVGALVAGVAADRVSPVPLLHGNDLGCVSGRLCDPAVSVADSPMRTATGALIGLGPAPVDKNGAPLTMAIIAALANLRFSVPQWYPGYDGVYWADMALLDVEGGDYQVYENLRVIDYLARRVRIRAIGRIADRRLNSSSRSISANKTYFMGPLRESARPMQFGSTELPAMIQEPEDGDISITWISRTEVAIGIIAQPHNCPKKIKVYLGLDLSGE